MNATWKVILGVLVIFLLGCAVGGMGASLILQHRALAKFRGGSAAMMQILERRTTRDLNLTPDQREKVHLLLMDNVAQRQQLQKQIQPQLRELNQQTLIQIDALLNPDQVEKFQENLDTLRRQTGHNPFPVPKVTASVPTPAPTSTNTTVGAAPAN